jgi:archaemetzincin
MQRCRIGQDGRHVQFQVNGVLTKLKQVLSDGALRLAALTMTDLYDEPPDLFVAGMAAGQDRVAVCHL